MVLKATMYSYVCQHFLLQYVLDSQTYVFTCEAHIHSQRRVFNQELGSLTFQHLYPSLIFSSWFSLWFRGFHACTHTVVVCQENELNLGVDWPISYHHELF